MGNRLSDLSKRGKKRGIGALDSCDTIEKKENRRADTPGEYKKLFPKKEKQIEH